MTAGLSGDRTIIEQFFQQNESKEEEITRPTRELFTEVAWLFMHGK
jgi:hypothetical protein